MPFLLHLRSFLRALACASVASGRAAPSGVRIEEAHVSGAGLPWNQIPQ